MQGWPEFIPTAIKAEYLNALLKVGFDTLDFGSFVSPKAIPQMKDTAEVLKKIQKGDAGTKLLAIVANLRGAEDALDFEEIDYLGYPFSVSEEFQKRNTNAGILESLSRVEEIQKLCLKKSRQLVIYISMGFGNPYGEDWSPEIVINWVSRLSDMGIRIIALSDTVGVSTEENISMLFRDLIPALPQVEFGAHLHSRPEHAKGKIASAWESGCRRFDSAIMGIGGCPMAKDELVGNLATETLLDYVSDVSEFQLKESEFQAARKIAARIFH